MKTKTVYTSALKYAKRVRILVCKYVDETMYVGLTTMSGEDYCDITTHIEPLEGSLGYIKSHSEAERFAIEQGLVGEPLSCTVSGFDVYNLYKFNIEGGKFRDC